ncbi:MAG: GAP family protein [archaeon]
MVDVNFIGITGLALADAINPCVLAVLTIILVTLLIQEPENRKKVLYSGLAFTIAIYIGYLFYGIIIMQFFRTFADIMREKIIEYHFYESLGILAMIIGALNIKDFFMYKPGGIATEMPLFMRPKVKQIIKKVTSPRGAFITGFIVTLFLLPCTIMPYFIANGILSKIPFSEALLWLLYYNLIFILPMLVIVGLVYYGFTDVNKVSRWKERKIKSLHLIAGILLFLVGFSLIMGWL